MTTKTPAETTIMIVDDDERVRDSCCQVLELAGYQVLTAEDGGECIQILRSRPGEIDLIILDWILPSMSGDQWLEPMLELAPQARVVFSTGQFITDALYRNLQTMVQGFLQKPFGADQLIEMVEKALGHCPEPEEQ